MDYAFIYRHLAHLMTGDIPPDPPNKATADRMIRLWVSLKDAVRAAVPTMETAIDKECSAMGAMFQQIITDMKVRWPLLTEFL